MDKKSSRIRRARKTRSRIARLGAARLCIYRSARHIYAQVIDESGQNVVASASSLDKQICGPGGNGGNVDIAQKVGETIAKKAVDAGVTKVAFDRSGFKYHGRIKALADAARENGLQF